MPIAGSGTIGGRGPPPSRGARPRTGSSAPRRRARGSSSCAGRSPSRSPRGFGLGAHAADATCPRPASRSNARGRPRRRPRRSSRCPRPRRRARSGPGPGRRATRARSAPPRPARSPRPRRPGLLDRSPLLLVPVRFVHGRNPTRYFDVSTVPTSPNPRASLVAAVRSNSRLPANGPRSTTRTATVFPVPQLQFRPAGHRAVGDAHCRWGQGSATRQRVAVQPRPVPGRSSRPVGSQLARGVAAGGGEPIRARLDVDPVAAGVGDLPADFEPAVAARPYDLPIAPDVDHDTALGARGADPAPHLHGATGQHVAIRDRCRRSRADVDPFGAGAGVDCRRRRDRLDCGAPCSGAVAAASSARQ